MADTSGGKTNTMNVVVIGNGNVGAAFIDSIMEQAPDRVRLIVYGEEPTGTYDRIRLSEYMAGSAGLAELGMRSAEWYAEHGIDARLGVRVVEINTTAQTVQGSDGESVDYDRLVIATGSSSTVPDLPDRNKSGVFVFRTVEDVEKMLEAAPGKAAVIGGGLLGLEAAYGLHCRGAKVDVVHRSGHLMNQQLDATAGNMLRREIEGLGIGVYTGLNPDRISGNGHVEGLELDDGTRVEADTVVICTGIRPNTELAAESGIETDKGILVDEYLRTSAENVYAIGECTEFEGGLIGLVAPGLTQMRIALAHILGEKTEPYRRGASSTNLKVMGVDLTSAGEVYCTKPGTEELVNSNPLEGTYRKAVIRNGKTVGAVLFGDISTGAQLSDAVKRGAPAEEVAALTVGAGGGADAPPLPDEAQVCDCNGVTKGQVVVAIQEKGAKSVSAVGAETSAGTSCGSCKRLVGEILEETADEVEEERNDLCKCMGLSQDDIKSVVREKGLTSVSEVGEACGAGKVCPDCKVGLTYVVSEANLNRHREERHARHINDRVHGNIQNDGTFSIVPRTRGGVTSSDELRRIADVADKYEARMVKITGSQRLDILGVKKDDLPKAWADLGMPSGFAYTKAFRQVKTCVGTDFCRYGVGDSTKLGIELEEMFENLYTPAKVKMGCSGCPRNCAESSVKDVEVIAIEGGWQIYVGGAAGMDVRKGDVLATVETEQEAKDVASAFMQYYRENGRWKERTYDFVPRMGLEEIQAVVLDEESGEPERLRDRLRESQAATEDPWKADREQNATKNQFIGELARK